MNLLVFRNKTLVLCLISAVYILGVIYCYNFTIDDTYISLRYAENLANYGQLSFNPGEEPTEGYSNFLLVLIEALFIKMGIGNVIQIPKFVGIIAGILTIIFTYRTFNSLTVDKYSSIGYIPAFAVAVSTPFVVWSIGGLETVLFTFLIVAAIYWSVISMNSFRYKHIFVSELFFLIATLNRPEGILFWGLTWLYFALNYKKTNLFLRIKSALPVILLFLGYLTWKYLYFGDFLPLTFYAKEINKSGFGTFFEGMYRFGFLMKINLNYIYLLLFIYSLIMSLVKKRTNILYVNLLAVAYLFYEFSRGYATAMDDVFRFYVPFLPLFYIVSVSGMYAFFSRLRTPQYLRVTVILLCTMLVLQLAFGVKDLIYANNIDQNFGSRNDNKHGLADYQREWYGCYLSMGQWLKENVPADSTIVMSDVGIVPFTSELRVLDIYSLVTKEIVYLKNERNKYPVDSLEYQSINKRIRDFVFDQNPEFIIQDSDINLNLDPRVKNYARLDGVGFYYYGEVRSIWARRDLVRF